MRGRTPRSPPSTASFFGARSTRAILNLPHCDAPIAFSFVTRVQAGRDDRFVRVQDPESAMKTVISGRKIALEHKVHRSTYLGYAEDAKNSIRKILIYELAKRR
jgi:hypothetical protein